MSTKDERIRELAYEQWGNPGEVEFDNDALISPVDDSGCWVQAWVWVDLSELEDEE